MKLRHMIGGVCAVGSTMVLLACPPQPPPTCAAGETYQVTSYTDTVHIETVVNAGATSCLTSSELNGGWAPAATSKAGFIELGSTYLSLVSGSDDQHNAVYEVKHQDPLNYVNAPFRASLKCDANGTKNIGIVYAEFIYIDGATAVPNSNSVYSYEVVPGSKLPILAYDNHFSKDVNTGIDGSGALCIQNTTLESQTVELQLYVSNSSCSSATSAPPPYDPVFVCTAPQGDGGAPPVTLTCSNQVSNGTVWGIPVVDQSKCGAIQPVTANSEDEAKGCLGKIAGLDVVDSMCAWEVDLYGNGSDSVSPILAVDDEGARTCAVATNCESSCTVADASAQQLGTCSSATQLQ